MEEGKAKEYDTRELFKSELDMHLNSYYGREVESMDDVAKAMRDYEQALLFRKLGYLADFLLLAGSAVLLGTIVAFVARLVGLA